MPETDMMKDQEFLLSGAALNVTDSVTKLK